MRIVFDASSLISVSQTCLVRILPALKEAVNAEFVIGPVVFNEIVSRPLNIKRFQLNAVRLDTLVKQGHLTVQELDSEATAFSQKMGELANNLFFIKNKPIRIMQQGELEALALVKQLNAEAIVVDERTARTLVEKPSALNSLMGRKYRKNIKENMENSRELKKMFFDCAVLRSVELIALAFEKNALAGQIENNKRALEAALYAAKFSGCAVSFAEIQNFLRGV